MSQPDKRVHSLHEILFPLLDKPLVHSSLPGLPCAASLTLEELLTVPCPPSDRRLLPNEIAFETPLRARV
jgi:hypothetical protein